LHLYAEFLLGMWYESDSMYHIPQNTTKEGGRGGREERNEDLSVLRIIARFIPK